MKPINLPPSLSTGCATTVPLLLRNLQEAKNFQDFDIAAIIVALFYALY